ALGTPLMRSSHRRMMVEIGQLVCVRKATVSMGMGVRNCRITSELSAGSSVKVGRVDVFTWAAGRIRLNARMMVVDSVAKDGRASSPPESSYWVAMEETFRASGGSL